MKKEFWGYKVVVGDKKGGLFWLSKSRIKALKWGKEMQKVMKPYMKKPCNVILKRIKLKKCDMSFCKELTFYNERYCLGCEKLIDDARDIDYEKRGENEL